MRGILLGTLSASVLACRHAAVPAPPQVATGKSVVSYPAPVVKPEEADPAPGRSSIEQDGILSEEDCGGLKCYAFQSPQHALAYVLRKEHPRVLGFGEAHGRQGQVGRSTVRRFAEDLLPTLAEHAGQLTVELLAPPTGCQTSTQAARETSSEITQGQAETNSSEYVALGHVARRNGIIPDILRASCEDMKRIESSQEGAVLAMMEIIATRSAEALIRSAAQTGPDRPLVLGYGGALHNDRFPRSGRETWSYAARVESAGYAYLEIDLVRPELLREQSAYDVMAWAPSVRALRDNTRSYLIQVGERAYALTLPPEEIPSGDQKAARAVP